MKGWMVWLSAGVLFAVILTLSSCGPKEEDAGGGDTGGNAVTEDQIPKGADKMDEGKMGEGDDKMGENEGKGGEDKMGESVDKMGGEDKMGEGSDKMGGK